MLGGSWGRWERGGRGEGPVSERWGRGKGRRGRKEGDEEGVGSRRNFLGEALDCRRRAKKKNYWKVDPREKGEGGGRRELGHVSGLWCFCISEWVCVAWCCTTQASCPYFIKVELVLWTLCIRIRSVFPWLISRLNDFTFLSNSSVTPFRMFQNWRLTLWYFPANGLPSLHLPSLHYLVTRPSPHASVCLNICN